MENVYLLTVLAPLVGAIVAGLGGRWLSRAGSHWVTTLGVAVSFACAVLAIKHHVIDAAPAFNGSVYTWMVSDGINFEIGFLVDRLTVLMMGVVTFVSLMVHIYTIGYMADDEHNWPDDSLAGRNSYQRFFAYISLFTFSMLMLVMANNFLQLFFGWEAVGLVSYLLIGFWSVRESAIYANLKAFLVNRVGDFGFLLGIAAVLMYTNTLDYAEVFAAAPGLVGETIGVIPGYDWSVLTLICILLFVGAMGKSAQAPLHVIFMVARMSPLFEFSETALSVVMVIGAITAFFMGLLGVVQNDIKRVVAYSTLSQLGYMTVALGASAYSAAIFHLMTHAFFKALLFLAAGSVIIAMHHEQDIRKMGGLKKYMPITYWTSLIGSLALIGFPGFAGFFSKDGIIEAVHHSTLPGSGLAYAAVLTGVFITALYSFRMFFLVFHTEERMDAHTREHLHETPAVVTVPLVLLAIPSVVIGYLTVGPVLFGGYFGEAIFVLPAHDVLGQIGADFHGPFAFMTHGLMQPPFWLAMAGLATAWYVYMKRPQIAEAAAQRFPRLHALLLNKYGFDDFNETVFAGGGRSIGNRLWQSGDVGLIDGLVINGSASAVGWFAAVSRHLQSGYLYHYAFAMVIGLLTLVSWFAFG
jgi:NADH-quinone oxidoreductase subunit L